MPTNPAAAPLYREVSRAALLGLIVNLMLGIAKLVGGIVWNSFALISDAVNSLGDVVTTIIVLVAFRIAQRPPDSEHPYGHTRAEGIAATNVAVLIILSALAVGWEAMQHIHQKLPPPPPWALMLAGVNIVIKETLYRYKTRVGKRTGSRAILANAWDHRADALCAAAVLLGLAMTRYGGPSLHWGDEAAAVLVAIMIVWSGAMLFHSAASDLMDVQADDDTIDRVRMLAAEVQGVRGIEKLWVRKSGLEYFADIHIEVDPQLTVATGHSISHAVKDHLLVSIPVLCDVLVHLEPHANDRPTG